MKKKKSSKNKKFSKKICTSIKFLNKNYIIIGNPKIVVRFLYLVSNLRSNPNVDPKRNPLGL